MSRLALAWCRAYTAAAPLEARDRRREEIESFVWEATNGGIATRRIALGAVKGAFDDLRWCQQQRSRADLAPLSATIGGSAAIAGVLITLSFAVTLPPSDDPAFVSDTLAFLAVVVLVVAYVDRLRHRKKPPNGS